MWGAEDTCVYYRVMRNALTTEVTAFVLAGGKSTRMGRDKAFLQFEGRTLLERALGLARSITSRVIIAGGREKFGAFGLVVEDHFSDCGPLAGIHAALRSSQTELNLVLGVDMPFVTGDLLRHLVSDAGKEPEAMAIVPRAERRLQTLCAVYRRGFADGAEKALLAGNNRIELVCNSVATRVIEEEELQRAGFSSAIFGNLNTPSDLESAKLHGHEEVHR
jgi:molybdenum cofactor guanylyltransferase